MPILHKSCKRLRRSGSGGITKRAYGEDLWGLCPAVVLTFEGSPVFFYPSRDIPGRILVKKIICTLFGILFVIAVSRAGALAAETFSVYDIPAQKGAPAEKYWTAEKMKKAIPFATPKKGTGQQQSTASASQQSTGLPGFDPSCDPAQEGTGASITVPDEAGVTGSSLGDTNVVYSYPPPHTTFCVLKSLYGTDTAPFPYRAIGKVFFTGTDGKDYQCSGAAIGGRAVLTAAHCLSDGKGTYYTHWVFMPAYHNETAPFGKWSAASFLTFDSYHQGANMARDVAFAVVKRHSDGDTLAQKVGHLGFAYNLSLIQHWSMFGYPASSPWTGELMVDTEASYASADNTETPNTPGIGTTQLSGCSGGPWIVNFVPGGTNSYNLANGVNSYSQGSNDFEIYAPYFDSDVKTMKDEAVAK